MVTNMRQLFYKGQWKSTLFGIPTALPFISDINMATPVAEEFDYLMRWYPSAIGDIICLIFSSVCLGKGLLLDSPCQP
jgi:hypothetical protein